MNKLFIHIGYHRTGTTFLQSLLSANKDMLMSLGCLYANTGFSGDSHSALALSLPNRRRRLVRKSRSGVASVSEDQLPDERQSTQLYVQLARELDQSGATVTVVSSECFLEFLDVGALQRLTQKVGLAPDIVVFIRRQDRWIESVYSHVVNDPNLAFGGRFSRLPQLKMLDFAGELKKWIDHFGRSRIHPVLYHEQSGSQRISRDLSSAVGLDPGWLDTDKVIVPPRHTNAGLDECCVEVLNKLNGWGLTTTALRKEICEKSESFLHSGSFSNWRLPVEYANRLCKRHRSRNEWLLKQFGIAMPTDWGEIDPSKYSDRNTKWIKFGELLESVKSNISPRQYIRLEKELMP